MDYASIARDVAATAVRAIESGQEPRNGVLSIRGHGHERLLGEIENDARDRDAFDRELIHALRSVIDNDALQFDTIHVGVALNSLRTWSYRRNR